MLPCPNCGSKTGVHHMRTHGRKIVYRQYWCGGAGRVGCGLVFNTHETIQRNEALERQIVDLYGKDRAPAQLERMFGKPGFKYKDIRLKPRA
jgi:hypothetical protein